jgi:hypothetical protein
MANGVGDLIVAGAYKTGLIRRESMLSLSAIEGIDDEIARGLGSTSNHEAVFLVSIIADDSRSIFYRSNAALVAEGHNDIVDELRKLSSDAEVQLFTRYLNGKVLNPYTTIEHATLMDSDNYRDGGGTPLYDQTVIALGTVIAKAVQLKGAGADVRTFTLIISDGADEHSKMAAAQSVAWLVGDLLVTGNNIVAAMGVNDGVTRFQSVFQQMGIKPGWILTPKDSRDKIRAAFREVSNTLTIAAGSDAAFTTLALGPGFV